MWKGAMSRPLLWMAVLLGGTLALTSVPAEGTDWIGNGDGDPTMSAMIDDATSLEFGRSLASGNDAVIRVIASFCPGGMNSTGSSMYRNDFSDKVFSWATEFVLQRNGNTGGNSNGGGPQLLPYQAANLTSLFLGRRGYFLTEYSGYLPPFAALPSTIASTFVQFVCRDGAYFGPTSVQTFCQQLKLQANLNSSTATTPPPSGTTTTTPVLPTDLPSTAFIPMIHFSTKERNYVIQQLCSVIESQWYTITYEIGHYFAKYYQEILVDYKLHFAHKNNTTTSVVPALAPTKEPSIVFSTSFEVRAIDATIPIQTLKTTIRAELIRLVIVGLSSLNNGSGGGGRRKLNNGTGYAATLTELDIEVMLPIACNPPQSPLSSSNNVVQEACYSITANIFLQPQFAAQQSSSNNRSDIKNHILQVIEFNQLDGAYFSNLPMFAGLPTTNTNYRNDDAIAASASQMDGPIVVASLSDSIIAIIIFLIVSLGTMGFSINFYDKNCCGRLDKQHNEAQNLCTKGGEIRRMRARTEEDVAWPMFHYKKKELRNRVTVGIPPQTVVAATAGVAPQKPSSFRLHVGAESA